MERLARQVVARSLGYTGLFVLLGLGAGCVTMEAFTGHGGDAPPTGPVCQLVATWQKKVAFAPDTVHAGRPMPGIAGRVYLFGPDIGFPLAGDGSVVVELYDDGPKANGGQPVKLEDWHFDPVTLKRLLKHDSIIGWGYTLFLPWGSYRPDICQVRLRVCYQPAKGTPIYANPTQLVLEHDPEEEAAVAAVKPPAAMPAVAAKRPANPIIPVAANEGGFASMR